MILIKRLSKFVRVAGGSKGTVLSSTGLDDVTRTVFMTGNPPRKCLPARLCSYFRPYSVIQLKRRRLFSIFSSVYYYSKSKRSPDKRVVYTGGKPYYRGRQDDVFDYCGPDGIASHPRYANVSYTAVR